MHDIRRIREHSEEVRTSLARKGFDADVDGVLKLDSMWRELTSEADGLKADLNRASKAIGDAKKAGRDAAQEMDAARRIRERAVSIDDNKRELHQQIVEILLEWPNEPDPGTPTGVSAEENVVVRQEGDIRNYDFALRDHLDLAEGLGILDMPAGAKLTGTGWPVYIGAGAALERALINFMLDVQTREHGYTEVIVPLVVNRETATGTGQLPKFEADLYRIESEDFFLIPTAEVPLTNLHAGEILDPEVLPRKYCSFTACFRREAGAHGQDTHGLRRVHQFNKVELVQIVTPENSQKAQLEILSHAEAILNRLTIPYRIVDLCAGDLSFGASRCFDIEIWAPGSNAWLEVSSVSNYGEFQSRRMNLRFRREKGSKPEYPHTLNGSGLATSRLMVALLETFQTPEGRIRVPKPLQPYLGAVDQITGVSL
ncbi:MAG: serine--tRNA ligase [bacterium]